MDDGCLVPIVCVVIIFATMSMCDDVSDIRHRLDEMNARQRAATCGPCIEPAP